jgi:hypothetical protein
MLTLKRLISLPRLQMGCIHNTLNLFCSFTCAPIKQSDLSTFVGFLKSEVLLLHSLKDLLTKQISVKLMG